MLPFGRIFGYPRSHCDLSTSGGTPVETIAVYKEERVKVYGITLKVDLVLVILHFPVHQLEHWGEQIILLENHIKQFELVTYHATNKTMTELHLLIEQKKSEPLREIVEKWLSNHEEAGIKLKQPVDILYLHGPHFQDRFGIAEIAFQTLQQNNIEILVSGCAGTSMYLVTPEKLGRSSRKILADTFLIPSST